MTIDPRGFKPTPDQVEQAMRRFNQLFIDPASHTVMLAQSRAAIGELLALLDAEKARADALQDILAAYQCECGDMLVARPLWSECGNCSAAKA